MKKILYFIKKETVLSIAVVLVVISVFFVVPDIFRILISGHWRSCSAL